MYVRRFDVRSSPWRVSTDGGGQPKWRADGQELYFLTADGMMMRVIGFEGLADERDSQRGTCAAARLLIREVSFTSYGVPSLRKTSWNHTAGSRST